MNTLQLHQERLDVLGSNFAELRQQMDSQKIQDRIQSAVQSYSMIGSTWISSQDAAA
jgi:hypothetical protein